MDFQSAVRNTVAVIGVFAIVGVGLGVAGYISVDLANSIFSGGGESQLEQSFGQLFVALILMQSIVTTFFLGPTVAGIAGVITGSYAESVQEALAVGGVGSFVGFYPMILLAIYIMAMALDGTGGGATGEPTQQVTDLSLLVKLALPTTAVGILSSGLVFWIARE